MSTPLKIQVELKYFAVSHDPFPMPKDRTSMRSASRGFLDTVFALGEEAANSGFLILRPADVSPLNHSRIPQQQPVEFVAKPIPARAARAGPIGSGSAGYNLADRCGYFQSAMSGRSMPCS